MSTNNPVWEKQATKVLDVRPILADGGEPFEVIMNTAAPLTSGQTLLIIAPFEPVPLYRTLGARGFTPQSQMVNPGEWWVLFTRA